jgi:CRISPR system Cascade subunit CasE
MRPVHGSSEGKRAMNTLYLVRTVIDPKAIEWYRERQQLELKGESDRGYALHAYLTALFGNQAPRPFQLEPVKLPSGSLSVLGYTRTCASTLKEQAQEFADPQIWSGVQWEQFSGKPMPSFRTRQVLAFSVRVCPVVRRGPNSAPRKRGEGPFAKLLQCQMNQFRLETVVRRLAEKSGKGREERRSVRPSAIMQGLLQVQHPEDFRHLLSEGVGRHRGFGFGMMLLRRAE